MSAYETLSICTMLILPISEAPLEDAHEGFLDFFRSPFSYSTFNLLTPSHKECYFTNPRSALPDI